MPNDMLGASTSREVGELLKSWEKYYLKVHGLKTDFSGIVVPEADDREFSRFVCRPKDFSPERAYSGGKQLYPKEKWTSKSLDKVLDLSFGRDGKTEPYIVRLHPNLEADEDLADISANQILAKGINTACLTERLLLGDFLFWLMGEHLDIQSITLSAGSRCSDGDVPYVIRGDGELDVDRCSPGYADGYLRARRAVSL